MQLRQSSLADQCDGAPRHWQHTRPLAHHPAQRCAARCVEMVSESRVTLEGQVTYDGVALLKWQSRRVAVQQRHAAADGPSHRIAIRGSTRKLRSIAVEADRDARRVRVECLEEHTALPTHGVTDECPGRQVAHAAYHSPCDVRVQAAGRAAFDRVQSAQERDRNEERIVVECCRHLEHRLTQIDSPAKVRVEGTAERAAQCEAAHGGFESPAVTLGLDCKSEAVCCCGMNTSVCLKRHGPLL